MTGNKRKCFYCCTPPINATTTKGLYVCRCYRLHNVNGEMKQYYQTKLDEWVYEELNRLQAENERLKKDSKRLKKVQMQLDDAMKMYRTITSEAIKEFAERLKNEAYKSVGIDEDFLFYNSDNKFETFDSDADVIEFLSEIVIKEMVGEG
ncbi:MAG: hypothetical protein IJZ16_04680 [Clostridia bacterium]|nr:hypothetical protein [Clostridia bacterium]